MLVYEFLGIIVKNCWLNKPTIRKSTPFANVLRFIRLFAKLNDKCIIIFANNVLNFLNFSQLINGVGFPRLGVFFYLFLTLPPSLSLISPFLLCASLSVLLILHYIFIITLNRFSFMHMITLLVSLFQRSPNYFSDSCPKYHLMTWISNNSIISPSVFEDKSIFALMSSQNPGFER